MSSVKKKLKQELHELIIDPLDDKEIRKKGEGESGRTNFPLSVLFPLSFLIVILYIVILLFISLYSFLI